MRAMKLFVAAMSMLGIFGGAVFAEDEGEIGFELTADFFNKYVWRGQNLVDDWVFQPGVSATYGGLTASFWGNLDLTDAYGKSKDDNIVAGIGFSAGF